MKQNGKTMSELHLKFLGVKNEMKEHSILVYQMEKILYLKC